MHKGNEYGLVQASDKGQEDIQFFQSRLAGKGH